MQLKCDILTALNTLFSTIDAFSTLLSVVSPVSPVRVTFEQFLNTILVP